MESVVSRLEAVASRLERYESSIQSPSPAPTPPTSRSVTSASAPKPDTQRPTPVAPRSSPQVTGTPGKYEESAWDSYVANEVSACASAAAALPEEFRSSTTPFVSGAKVMVDVIKLSQQRGKPSMEELQAMVQPLAQEMQNAESLTHGARTSATNHRKAAAECMQSLAWITYDTAAGAPSPDAIIADALGAAEMFINRVIMDFRDTATEHKTWALALKAAMQKLQQLAQLQFPTGLTWTGAGRALAPPASEPPTPDAPDPAPAPADPEAAELADALSPVGGRPEDEMVPAVEPPSEEAAAGEGTKGEGKEGPVKAEEKPAARKGGAPPPPPPPPAGMLMEKLKANAASGGSARGGDSRTDLMSALNRGSNVTSGLRKVTDDMKTKNLTERSGVVKAPTPPPAKKAMQARGPTRKELQQNRWHIENWVACEPLELKEDDVKRSHAVCVSNCAECVVQVHGKVNTIMLDGCRKVGLVFGSVVSTVELVNCNSCKVQCNVACPTLNIDKTDGANVYLSQEAAAVTEVVSSKSSSMSVTVLGADEGKDPVESPVPEQFMSKMVDGKLVTTPVIHM